jgi:hypothetical protein
MKRTITAILTIALIFTLTSCGAVMDAAKKGAEQATNAVIQTGTWNEAKSEFTNEWSNLKLVLPEGFASATDEEIEQMDNASKDLLSEQSNELAAELAMAKIRYDFIVRSVSDGGMPNLIVIYENISLSPQTKNLDEAGYIAEMEKQFATMEAQGLKYTAVETDTAEIAGETWTATQYSLNDGVAFQRYYLRKVEGIMFQMILTYNAELEDSANQLLAGLSKAK